MANQVDLTLKVSVEKSVHDSLRHLAQAIWDQHAICIQDVRFSWVDVSTPGENQLILTDVKAETLTKY